MLTLTNDMMRQIIMDHYSNPIHKHQPTNPNYKKVHMHSDNCIDDIDVFLTFDNGIITEACFDGVGCTISTSSTDIMCELLIGKNEKDSLYIIDQYLKMIHEQDFDKEVLDEAIVFINTSKQASRIRCATIGWTAANEIIESNKDEK